MTSTSKKLIASLAIAALISPLYAHAYGDSSDDYYGRTKNEDTRKENFENRTPKDAQACLRLEQGANGIKNRLENNRSKWAERKNHRHEKLTDRKGDGNGRLNMFRGDSDKNRDRLIARLLEKYPDADDQTAIEAFDASIDASVAKRRVAIDAAMTVYLEGVEDLLGSRQDRMDTALATMKASIEAAMNKAKDDCASGMDKQEVYKTLQASIKAAKEKFEAERKISDATSAQLEALRKTRETAIKAAIETFKTEAKAARDTLKIALED